MGYESGKIYKLEGEGMVYIGSTKMSLSQRKWYHKGQYNYYVSGRGGFCRSFDIISTGNYDIFLIENFPCKSKDELRARERFWINQIDCINKIKNPILHPGEKQEYNKQYREQNKEYIKQYMDQWRENNLDKKKQMDKDYYEKNKNKLLQVIDCECGAKIAKCGYARHIKTEKHKKRIPVPV